MTNIYKSDVKFISDNNGALFTKGPGSMISVTGNGNRTISITGDTGYDNTPYTHPIQFRGVCMAGMEFGGGAYIPKSWVLNHWLHNGANIIRVPVKWEYIQPVLLGPLDQSILNELKSVISEANSLGMTAIVDIHNFGKYNNLSENFTAQNLVDLWQKLVGELDQYDVHYDLMNEPGTTVTDAVQASIYNACITAIRSMGSTRIIHVPTPGANKIQYTITKYESFIQLVTEFDSNCVFQVHVYPDSNQSGTSSTPLCDTRFVLALNDYAKFARLKGFKMFIGEVATGRTNELALEWIDKFFDKVAKNADVILGYTWWADGGSWTGSYVNLATDQTSGWDFASGVVLRKYLGSEPLVLSSPIPGFSVAVAGGTPVYSTRGVTGGTLAVGHINDRSHLRHSALPRTIDVVLSIPSGTTFTASQIVLNNPLGRVLYLSTAGQLKLSSTLINAANVIDGNDHHVRMVLTPDGTTSPPVNVYLDGVLSLTTTVPIPTSAETTIGIGGAGTVSSGLCLNGGFVKMIAVYNDAKGAPTAEEMNPHVPTSDECDGLVYYMIIDENGPSLYGS